MRPFPRAVRRSVATLVLVAVAMVVCGCANLRVGPATPRPNVAVRSDRAPTAIALGTGVSDSFVIPGTASVNEVPVVGWHGTLRAGYHAAFGPGTPDGPRPLELWQADLAFAPAAVGTGGTRAVVATIRYKARLTTPRGERVLAGTVTAREANVSPSPEGMTDNAAKAVEALYEELARQIDEDG